MSLIEAAVSDTLKRSTRLERAGEITFGRIELSDTADISDQIDQAEKEARLALLKSIAQSAAETTSAQYLERLSHGFALTVGAMRSKLPGGYVEPTK